LRLAGTRSSFKEWIFDLAQGSGIAGVFQSDAIGVAPVALPAPSASGPDCIALNVRRRMFCRERGMAVDAARRGVGSKVSAACAGCKERLPSGIDDLVGFRGRRKFYEEAIGVVERGERPACVAVGVREVAEPCVQERVTKNAKAMFTVAFVQRKHGSIIVQFLGVHEGPVDRAEPRS